MDAVDPKTLTVKQMLELFEQHHLSQLKDPRSLRCLIRKHFPPLHDRLLASLTRVTCWTPRRGRRAGAR